MVQKGIEVVTLCYIKVYENRSEKSINVPSEYHFFALGSCKNLRHLKTFLSAQILSAMLLAVFEWTWKLLLPGLQSVRLAKGSHIGKGGMLGCYAELTRPGPRTIFRSLLSNLLYHGSPQGKRSGSSPFNSHCLQFWHVLTVGGYCVRLFSCCALIITISSCSFWALAVVLDRFFRAAVHYWASKQQDIYNT